MTARWEELEMQMLTRVKGRILSSPDWITVKDIAKVRNLSESDVHAQLNNWRNAYLIFGFHHNGIDYFPLFGLDMSRLEPLPAMKEVLATLRRRDPWSIACWFDGVNSYLDGRRPQDVIAGEPDKVIAAALADANWECNG